MLTSVSVHWNKSLPSQHPLPCLILLGLSWCTESGHIPFISKPDWEVTAASEVEIKDMHARTMEAM